MKRIAIRERATDMLQTLAEFHGNVFDKFEGRTFDELQLPAIEISWGDEEETDAEFQPFDGGQLLTVPLLLEVTAQDKEGIVRFADLSIYRIKELFKTDPTMQDNAMTIRYTGSTALEPNVMGNLPASKFTISMQVLYHE